MTGYAVADAAAAGFVAFLLAFAGGAVITMVADSMLPEAYRNSGLMTGLAVAFGFAVAFFAHALD
jgi:ZIP family zinc transporter